MNGTEPELTLAGRTKKITERPIITVGSIGLTKANEEQGDSLGALVDRYDRGEFDIAAGARAALTNPESVNKLRAGRYDGVTLDNKDQHKLTLH